LQFSAHTDQLGSTFTPSKLLPNQLCFHSQAVALLLLSTKEAAFFSH